MACLANLTLKQNTSGVLAFSAICNNQSPKFLNSFDLPTEVTYGPALQIIHTVAGMSVANNGEVFITVTDAGVTATKDNGAGFISPPVVTAISNERFTVTFDASALPNPTRLETATYTIDYQIMLSVEGNTVVMQASVVNHAAEVLGIPSSPEGVTAIPNLFARIYLTNDGQNICQVYFLVLESHFRSLYTQYCVRVQDLLKGRGCTLQEKVNSLITGGFSGTFISVISYSMLRYILSKLLFGDFSVQYLRQRYYTEFLERLVNSPWSSFLSYFTGMFAGYERLFKK